MTMLLVLLLGICLAAGLYLGYLGMRNYRRLLTTANKVGLGTILRISAQFGSAGAMVVLAVALAVGLLDATYKWTPTSFTSIFLVAIAAGILITLGGLYQVCTSVVYRDHLFKYFRKTK